MIILFWLVVAVVSLFTYICTGIFLFHFTFNFAKSTCEKRNNGGHRYCEHDVGSLFVGLLWPVGGIFVWGFCELMFYLTSGSHEGRSFSLNTAGEHLADYLINYSQHRDDKRKAKAEIKAKDRELNTQASRIAELERQNADLDELLKREGLIA